MADYMATYLICNQDKGRYGDILGGSHYSIAIEKFQSPNDVKAKEEAVGLKRKFNCGDGGFVNLESLVIVEREVPLK